MIETQRSMSQQVGSRTEPPNRTRRRTGARLARWLRRGDRSAVAMEMGIIAIPFFMMFLGVMEMSYDLYVQAEMNNAVELSARGVQVGASQGASGENSSAFIAGAVCNNLGGLLDCGLLTVGVAPIPKGYNYYSLPVQDQLTQGEASGGNGVCTGVGGQMMVLKAWYDGPTFVGLLIPAFTTTYNSALTHVTTASAGFVNEWFAGGQSTGTACSL
jgi:hypothetical protein